MKMLRRVAIAAAAGMLTTLVLVPQPAHAVLFDVFDKNSALSAIVLNNEVQSIDFSVQQTSTLLGSMQLAEVGEALGVNVTVGNSTTPTGAAHSVSMTPLTKLGTLANGEILNLQLVATAVLNTDVWVRVTVCNLNASGNGTCT